MFDVNQIRKDFPMFSNNPDMIYFDSAATTFKPQSVIDEVTRYYTHLTCNIHRGDYEMSHSVSTMYDEARNTVKNFIHADKNSEIIFTSGTTAALNMIAIGLTHLIDKNDVILTTEAEHASSIMPWFKVAEKTGAKIEYIPLNDETGISIEQFKKALHSKVKVVVIAAVSNVLGYKLNIKEMTRLAHEVGAIIICDGAQMVPHMAVDVVDLDVDFMAFSGHKCCSPTGIGILYGKYHLLKQMEPIFYGGGSNARFNKDGCVILKDSPDKFESGTPAIEAVLGLKTAIEYIENIGIDHIEAYEEELKKYAVSKLKKLDNIELYNEHSSTGIIAFNIKGIFAQDVGSYLSTQNICVRTGNHCAKILPEILKTEDTVRASLYFYNTKEEIDRFVEVLKETTLEKCLDFLF